MKGKRLGFISLCSLCLAARNEIMTVRQKDYRYRQQIGRCRPQKARNLMGEGGKLGENRGSGER